MRDSSNQKVITTRKQTGLHADEICPWTTELSVSGRELLYHCTAEEQTYRDRAATGGMALSKPVTAFLVSPA